MIRRLVLALLGCLFAGQCWAAVAIDATGTDKVCTSGTSCDFTGLTVGAGLSNGALLCAMQFDANVSAITATWDNGGTNQATARIGSGVLNVRRAELFGLVAPTSGNKTLHVTWTTTAQLVVDCISVSGADQTGGTTTFANSNTNTSTANANIGVTITGATGDMVAASAVTEGSFGAPAWVAPATSIYGDNTPTNMSGGAGRSAGGASVTITANTSGSGSPHNAIIGVDIVAAAAASTCPLTRTRMGVGC